MDGSKNPKPALAAGTFQDIDFEDALHQLGPGVITEAWGWQRRPMRGLGGLGQGGNVSGGRGWRATAGMRVRFPIRRRHDGGSPFRGWSQYSVIANQMGFWTRDEGREFFEQVQGSQDNVRGSVTPRPFEAIEKASIGQRL